MRNALALVSAAYAGIALASFLAISGIGRLIAGIARVPEAVGDFPAGIAEVTQLPTVAAWVAIAASLVALVLPRHADDEGTSRRGAWLAALGIGLGAASVLVFRAVADYIPYTLRPGRILQMGEIVNRLTLGSAITAVCFAAAVVTAILAFRTRAASRFAVIALVVSLGVSASLVVTLRSLSTQYHAVANGRLDIERLR